MINKYPFGTPAKLTVNFKYPLIAPYNGKPYDMDNVVIQHINEVGVENEYALSRGQITFEGAGTAQYHVYVNMPNPGVHKYKGYGYIGGIMIATTDDYAFEVKQTVFPLPTLP